MHSFSEIFTVTGVFMLHGIRVELASVTLQYRPDDPAHVVAIGAKYLRKRLHQFLDLQGDLERGDKLLDLLNIENSFARYSWRDWQERQEYARELKELNIDYLASRGI